MPIPGDHGYHILLWSRKWMKKHLWLLSIQSSPILEYTELGGTHKDHQAQTVSVVLKQKQQTFSPPRSQVVEQQEKEVQ